MKSYIAILLFLFAKISIAQEGNKNKPQQLFFTQIDSIVNDRILSETQKGCSLVVVHVNWYVGSVGYSRAYNIEYDNAFDIYIYSFLDKVVEVQKIDNFGLYKRELIRNRRLNHIRRFITSHFIKMNGEILKEKVDTTYNDAGEIQYTRYFSSDELVVKMSIHYNHDRIDYKLPLYYRKNPANQTTYKYKLITLLESQYKLLNRKIRRR